MDVEIVVNATTEAAVQNAVEACLRGGAARVELCAAMELDGLTPATRWRR